MGAPVRVVIGEAAPVYADAWATVYHGDALALLPQLPSASINLILVDPPYMGVKAEAWDRQWKTRADYLAWLRGLALEWQRLLTPNGSLYCFASPQMAAHVEVMLGEVFAVIQRVTWRKPPFSTKAEMFDKDTIRMYFPASEAILFCEQYSSEGFAQGESGYQSTCADLHCHVFGKVFGDYLRAEFLRAGVTQKQIAALFPSQTGGLTGCVSNWLLGYNRPTAEQYTTMRDFLSQHASGDYLRREYEDLRREYEDLRRPFTVSSQVPYTDVWDYATVPAGPEKHPCEKPLPLLRHIITASTRPGDIVLDCCAGSGSTLEAARQCWRRGIAIEQEARWVQRIIQRVQQADLFTPPTPPAQRPPPVQEALFGTGRPR